MNIEEILTEAFIAEAKRQNIPIISSDITTLRRKFNLVAVQRAVDTDIERTKRQFIATPHRQREEVEKRERYHRANLRKLAQDYAKILATEQITYITESNAEQTRTLLKASAAKPCDAYPC